MPSPVAYDPAGTLDGCPPENDPAVWFRFWDKVRLGPGCWEWQAAANTKGYGNFKLNGRVQTATRVVWKWLRGPDPGRLMVLHHCDNPACVNPGHLFLGTATDNARDSVDKGRHPATHKTHCPHGHPYSGDNLVIRVRANGREARVCRACDRARALRNYYRRKARGLA